MWPFNDRKRPKGFRRIMLLQELEQRIVLDAAVADQPQQDNVDPGADREAGAQAAGAGQPAVQAADQPAAKGVAPNQVGSDHPLDVILVSNALTDVSAVSGAAVSDSTVIVYDAAQDTLSSVTAKLNDLVATTGEKIDHIAILSHGEAGILKLSSTSFFDVASVQANPADWHTLSTLLTGDARIDLYACSLGQGVQGLALVQSIAQATGATVWASDDMTGTATGADWDLEVKSASSGLGSLIDPEAVIVSGLYLASVPIVDGQTVSVSEDGTLTITVTGSDSDDPDPSMVSFTVTNSVTHGALSVIGAVSRASAGHYSQQFQYIPTYDYNGSDSFEFVMTTPTDDTSDPATVSITVSPVNDAPVNTVPDVVQDTLPDGSIVFSAANGNQILVSDIDAGTGFLKVTVTATHGTLTLNGLSGLTFDPGQGDGTADAAMVFTGTLADINNALDGMTFTRDAGYVGMASVTVAVNDQGNTGEGGPQSATDTVSISAEPYGAWFAGFGAEAGWDVFNYEGGSFYTQDYTAYWRCEDPGTWSFWNGAAWVATDNVGNAPYGDGFGPYATWFVDTVIGGTYEGYEVYIAQGVTYFSLDHDATGATYWRVADAPEWSYYDGSAWYSTGGFQVEPMNVWFHGSGDYAGWDVYNYDVGSYYTQDYSLYWRCEDPDTWSFWNGTAWVATDELGNAPTAMDSVRMQRGSRIMLSVARTRATKCISARG